jgi:uncharacterized membrane protein SpoIIM required for sporulation
MRKVVLYLGIGIMVLALVSLIIGVVFVQQGLAKQAWIVNAMKQEKITFNIDGKDVVIDNAEKAEKAGDTVREHRHNIAPTYGDLLGGDKFNPTDPRQLTYAQALNLENYLYLAVATFGLITVVIGSGAFMIINGIALGATGFAIIRIAKG